MGFLSFNGLKFSERRADKTILRAIPSPSKNHIFMKKSLLFIVFAVVGFAAIAQEPMEKIMEGRARELYRVLGLTSSDDYKKFMRENYTKALLDKPVKMSKQVSDSDGGNENNKSEGMD